MGIIFDCSPRLLLNNLLYSPFACLCFFLSCPLAASFRDFARGAQNIPVGDDPPPCPVVLDNPRPADWPEKAVAKTAE